MVNSINLGVLAHLSRRLTRCAYSMVVEPSSVRASVRAFTLSILNISKTSWPIAVRFYMRQHWGGGVPAIVFLSKSDRNSGFHSNR